MKTIRQYCFERGITLRQFSNECGKCANWGANLQYKNAYIQDFVLYSKNGRVLHKLKSNEEG